MPSERSKNITIGLSMLKNPPFDTKIFFLALIEKNYFETQAGDIRLQAQQGLLASRSPHLQVSQVPKAPKFQVPSPYIYKVNIQAPRWSLIPVQNPLYAR